MTHRPRGRQSRNSWSALLAVLLGVVASASSFAVSVSVAGGLSIAGHGADTRSTSTPTTVRPDRFDSALNFGGLDDPSSALPPQGCEAADRFGGLVSRLTTSFVLAMDVTRTRAGRTRAPPKA